jgi:5-methyltetrahydropteroyltriglutamate--homocysteine methyltransferase
MSGLPLLPVTTVGSWPRPRELREAWRGLSAGRLTRREFDAVADRAVLGVLEQQTNAGVDLITDGEQRRDNFYSFVAGALEGVRMMTLAEMLEIVEDKAGFERLLQTLDVPAYSISNPTCVGPIRRRTPLALDELNFVKLHTKLPVKVPLPGPYLLSRAMWVPEASRAAYASKEELADAVVGLLRDEIADLIAAGAAFIQLDEPVLTEVAFNPGGTRTFMCAALAARKDPAEELEWAVSLINRVLEGSNGVRFGIHVCRGNWSRDETTLLTGGYHPLAPYLTRLQVDQLVLEYATERAGDLLRFGDKELGLGVVNPRTDDVETVAEVRHSVERALTLYPASKLFLNPDCGFGTFAGRPMATPEVAAAKLRVVAEAARELRRTLPA